MDNIPETYQAEFLRLYDKEPNYPEYDEDALFLADLGMELEDAIDE